MFKKLTGLSAVLCVLILIVASPVQAGKHDPIYTPEVIQVPPGKTSEDVKRLTIQALLNKGWEVREIGPGHLQSMYTKRNAHTAVIDIQYDPTTIRISYAESENLNYDKNDNTIHGTYNKWIRNVEKYIRAVVTTQ